ncbi:YceI family protein [Pseudomonas violetae]|jgi:polyisoprenoid-binding protein YceI|uniref:YceI family protein n=1 Tax=Pseudomonas violetae TaxID=2915813 RepID=A0ABT0F6G4_9PSED|nr:YceI family protein [Pseudomonas violetae]MCK1793593.1 YceI family protein [Pseudomonas violetae]
MSRRFPCSIALAIIFSMGTVPWAQATEYTRVNPTASQISFTFNQMGSEVYGTFSRFEASFEFDTANPTAARTRLVIDMASIDAGSSDANIELQKPAWFNTPEFPQGVFESTGVTDLGNNRYAVAGNLTIRGLTREVQVQVELKPESGIGLFNGEFVLDRDLFKIGEGEWADTVVSKDIDIKFRVVAPEH